MTLDLRTLGHYNRHPWRQSWPNPFPQLTAGLDEDFPRIGLPHNPDQQARKAVRSS